MDFCDNFDVVLKCASGVESVLKKELFRFGISETPAINGSITIKGNPQMIARLNINLRTCDRVYIKLGEFTAVSFDELFDNVKEINFEDYIPIDAEIRVNGKCVKSQLFSITDCQKIIKKAIVSRYQRKYHINRLMETGFLYEIEFSIFKDKVTILLNTSGEGLHKRGYRDLVGIAPIKETLASSLLLMSDGFYKNPFLDPFCGSGTLAIENAKIALNIAPNILRKFAFNNWKNFDEKFYKNAYEEAKDNEQLDRKVEIYASDIDKKAISLAIHHSERAGVRNRINFEVKQVKDVEIGKSNGTIVTNPPYGERVFDKREAEKCYQDLRFMYEKLDNWSLFLITSANNFPKVFGKKPDRERKMYNSNKECKFYYYYKDGIKHD